MGRKMRTRKAPKAIGQTGIKSPTRRRGAVRREPPESTGIHKRQPAENRVSSRPRRHAMHMRTGKGMNIPCFSQGGDSILYPVETLSSHNSTWLSAMHRKQWRISLARQAVVHGLDVCRTERNVAYAWGSTASPPARPPGVRDFGLLFVLSLLGSFCLFFEWALAGCPGSFSPVASEDHPETREEEVEGEGEEWW